MIIKQCKLVYVAVLVKILVASWNISDPNEEFNLETYNSEYYPQYGSAVPEYSRLQPYENEMHNGNIYNDPMSQGFFNTEAPIYQYNSFAPEYTELQQMHENGVWGYTSYNNDFVTWESYNSGIPLGSEPAERISLGEIENLNTEQFVTEINQTGRSPSPEMQMSPGECNRQVDELIKRQEAAELDTLALDDYSRLIEEVVEEQETTWPNTLVNNLEEMPMHEPIKEHRPYDILEHAYNSTILQPTEDFSYEYSNSAFLYNFLRSPSPFITADSIRVRLSGQFLSFLSSDQVIRVLIVLLENKLELSKEDQKEFIETIFGHIDYSLELVITKDQVVMLVEAMMRSSVPDYFEYVFLTWKMWYSFTMKEQELMLKDAKREHKREILVMLYLFVINKDEDNSQQCEIFKNNIKNLYMKTGIFINGHTLENVVIRKNYWKSIVIHDILNTLDTCLVDIPALFKSIGEKAVTPFCEYLKVYIFAQHKNSIPHSLRYGIHVCYVLTKFIKECVQETNTKEHSSAKIHNGLCFDAVYVKYAFINWIKILNNNNSLDNGASIEHYKKEFRNAFGMFRQIVQSNKYNYDLFFKILRKVCFTKAYDKPFLILLFMSTNINILRDLMKTQEWVEYIKRRSRLSHSFVFIEDIFINNANPDFKLNIKYNTVFCVVKIHRILAKLNKKEGITMHREHYFCQRFLFHPHFRIFNDFSMLGYIKALSKTGQFNNKAQCDQIARDLVFSEYYHKTAMRLKNMPKIFGKEPELVEFKKSMEKEWEIYKNKENIEVEREMFRRC
ncbi:hypothetical protein PAEPH01_1336 [Pancytospora epiphaga]|nr:hypothetical protein PAEPH01_1336 [Pancytospora epiphaga]